MELKQLEVFDAIMRSGSVSAAAQELGITQSAVSKILARLEASIGFSLFTRANGRLTPTHRANAVLLQARDILQSISTLQTMSRIDTQSRPALRFVTVPSLSYELIPSVLASFAERRSDIRFGFDIRTTEATLETIVRSEAEFAIVALPISHPALQVTQLFRTVSCAVMRPDHKLAGKEVITPKDLFGEKMIFLLQRQPTRQIIEDCFLREGFSPDIYIETSNVATACRCAVNGLGIAIVNGLMAGYSASSDIVIKPFEPRIHHMVVLAELSGRKRSDAAQLFVDCMIEEVKTRLSGMDIPVEFLV